MEQAVQAFAQLPGIGRKTALRLVLHLLRQDNDYADRFTTAIATLKHEVKFCQKCHNVSDTDICPICADETAQRCVS